MLLREFDYNLPKNLIAQKPISPRDYSRLLVLNRKNKLISHNHFYKIDKFLKKGDVLVLNKSKVIPARIFGKKTTGGKIEILLLRPNIKNLKKYIWCDEWRIINSPNLKIGQKIIFTEGLKGEIIKVFGFQKIIKFNKKGEKLKNLIYKIGLVPIPPYIKSKKIDSKLKKDYQTIFAKNIGSVAAPTAGFHFTGNLIRKLKKKGIKFKYIVLHVGFGTFAPVKTEKIEDHKMEKEWVEIDKKTADFLNKAKKDKRRIIAVGTTTTRALESFTNNNKLNFGNKFVDIFICPGYKFQFIDSLITNFHLPKSTLLMLVFAFADKELALKAYQEAIKKKYRFYSFGDAMFII